MYLDFQLSWWRIFYNIAPSSLWWPPTESKNCLYICRLFLSLEVIPHPCFNQISNTKLLICVIAGHWLNNNTSYSTVLDKKACRYLIVICTCEIFFCTSVICGTILDYITVLIQITFIEYLIEYYLFWELVFNLYLLQKNDNYPCSISE